MAESYHSLIRDHILHVIDDATSPLTTQQIFDGVEKRMTADGRQMTEYDLEITSAQSSPRWQVRTRVILATMAKNGEHVVSVGRGIYAPITLSPEDIEEEGIEEQPTEIQKNGWVYAYSIPMAPGLLKVGCTKDLEKRMQQHRLQHAKAHLPDAPYLVAAWKIYNYQSAEKALHGILGLREKQYVSSGSGREWFHATLEDVQSFLDLAAGLPVPAVDVSRFNEI